MLAVLPSPKTELTPPDQLVAVGQAQRKGKRWTLRKPLVTPACDRFSHACQR